MATFIGTDGPDTFTGGPENDEAYGRSGPDRLIGNGGNDTLAGQFGADYIDGGDGDDIIASQMGLFSGESDARRGLLRYSFDTDAEQDTLLGGAGSDEILAGYNDIVDGGGFDEVNILSISLQGATAGVNVDFTQLNNGGTLFLGTGRISNITALYDVRGSEFDDVIVAFGFFASNNKIFGLGGNDTLISSASTDFLSGGAGNDTLDARRTYSQIALDGGEGNDIYFISGFANTVTERPNGGIDTVIVTDTFLYFLPANVENLTLIGTSVGGIGNDLDNLIIGSFAGSYLEGGAGTDTLRGMGSDDTFGVTTFGDVYDGGRGTDTLTFEKVAAGVTVDLSRQGVSQRTGPEGSAPDLFFGIENVIGTRFDDILIGDANGNRLFGENGNNLLSGNEGSDTLVGGSGKDTLDGGAGADSMDGGTGDDVYFVDNVFDYIADFGSFDSIDIVYTKVSYELGFAANIETLIVQVAASTDPLNLTGNAFVQTIVGNFGANRLTGGGGADTLIGLRGDDTYIVSTTDTLIRENAGEGNDTAIICALNYQLAGDAEIETLSAAVGTAAINIAGNGFSQVINGNDGANILSSGGGGGVDTMNGGLGDDIYRVFSTGDVINDTGGFDTVYASGTSYFLYSTAAVEYLSTSEQAGTQGFYMVGNGASQLIVGNWGDNTLNGRGGDGVALPDTLIGLYGNDTYGVFSQGDVVREIAGQGNDVVFASASYQLRSGTEIEVLSAVDQSAGDVGSAYTLRGNEFGQIVAGNNAGNVLDGRGGNDVLVGLGGNDTFAFTTALDGTNNVDTVRDFASGSDKVGLASDVFAAVTDGGIVAGEFVIGTAAADADDRLVYDQATGRLFFDADGNGSGAAVLFAQFGAGTVLAASDFVVVAPVASLPSA